MSRGLDIDRDDDRSRDEEARRVRESREAHVLLRDDDERDPDRRSESLPSRDFALPDGRDRETVHLRAWGYRLRDTESQTLVAAGRFRVVFERDLCDGPYRGDTERLAQDVKALRAQGLLDRRTIATDEQGHSVGVLALTERGRTLLEARSDREPEDGPTQAVYAGWHKPAEVVHDASIYRMFQRGGLGPPSMLVAEGASLEQRDAVGWPRACAGRGRLEGPEAVSLQDVQVEAAAIEDRGGRIDRVVLDDELKREVYASAHRSRGASDEDRQHALEDAAHACHLPIIEGHVEFPDLRIEYETAGGERGRVDLELVTSAYHGGHLAGKQAAGFTLYSAHGSAARGIHALGSSGGGGVCGHERYISSLLSL